MYAQSEDKNKNRRYLRFGIITVILISSICCISGIVLANSSDLSENSGNSGWFMVESVPQSGEVYFDGQSYGSTPALIPVRSDSPPSHEVTVKMDGYEEYTKQITYNPGNGETVPIVLDATQTLDNIVEFLNQN